MINPRYFSVDDVKSEEDILKLTLSMWNKLRLFPWLTKQSKCFSAYRHLLFACPCCHFYGCSTVKAENSTITSKVCPLERRIGYPKDSTTAFTLTCVDAYRDYNRSLTWRSRRKYATIICNALKQELESLGK